MFLLALTTSAWLWNYQGASVQGVGEVDSPRVDLASPTAGMVVSLPSTSRGQWLIYDHVRAGDVIAQIEDQQLESSKSVLREDLRRLVDQLRFIKPDDDADAPLKESWEAEHARLAALEKRVATGPIAEAQGDETAPAGEDSLDEPPGDEKLANLRTARISLERRWEELRRRSQMLEIQSPISGTLAAVYCWPGQTVPPGGLIATIVADHGQQIVGYIPENSTVVPKPGSRVALRTRVTGSEPIMSEVEEVGQRIEELPRHQRAVSSMPQWGIPVRIKMPVDAPLRPGSLLDLYFYDSDAG